MHLRYLLLPVFTAACTPAQVATPAADPSIWLGIAESRAEKSLNLADSSILLDTFTIAPSMYHSFDGATFIFFDPKTEGSDTVPLTALPPGTSGLRITFTFAAVTRLGYFKGRLTTFAPLAQAVWREIPASSALTTVSLSFDCGSEMCDGRDYYAPTLDRHWPRRRR